MQHHPPGIQIGDIFIGDKYPVVVQSMTNTDTADIKATVKQILELYEAGAEIVRFTINNFEAAKATPTIVERVRTKVNKIGLVGDFHFNGNKLLKRFPDCAQALDKYRINPGNVDDKNFREMIEMALKNKKAVRIGVNAGSIDSKILDQLMEKNAKLDEPQSVQKVLVQAVSESALKSAKLAEKWGLPKHRLVLSAKMSEVRSTIEVYEQLAKKNYALHLGLTEAGMGDWGVVSSSVVLGVLLHKNIGSTIRISLTPTYGVPRTKEVEICQILLQSLGLKSFRPQVTSCPGCGRTSGVFFQKLATRVNQKIDEKISEWRIIYPGIENLKVAVMGCIVNGPGESKYADIGISLPGKMEKLIAPVYIEGTYVKALKGNDIEEQFLEILEKYVKARFGGT